MLQKHDAIRFQQLRSNPDPDIENGIDVAREAIYKSGNSRKCIDFQIGPWSIKDYHPLFGFVKKFGVF